MVARVGIEPTTRGFSERCRFIYSIFLGLLDSRYLSVTETVTDFTYPRIVLIPYSL
jgi:hypothetical protein